MLKSSQTTSNYPYFAPKTPLRTITKEDKCALIFRNLYKLEVRKLW